MLRTVYMSIVSCALTCMHACMELENPTMCVVQSESIRLESPMGRSGPILRLVRRQVSEAIPAREYSFNMRDGLTERVHPVQRRLSHLFLSRFLSA